MQADDPRQLARVEAGNTGENDKLHRQTLSEELTSFTCHIRGPNNAALYSNCEAKSLDCDRPSRTPDRLRKQVHV
jgi:hypothetical protein